MDLIGRRLFAQGLIDSELSDPEAVVGRLLAVQAQDARGARLAIRARLAVGDHGSDSGKHDRVGASAVDRALDDRSLVVGWLNRGTLHLVLAEDYRWLAELTAPRLLTSNRTRLRQEGVSEAKADRGVRLICRQLADGPANRAELKATLESAGIPVAGQAMVHILFLASLRGLILRGPMAGREQAFVLVDDWLGKPEPIEPEEALARLARRFLAGHGPAGDRDLAKWAGVALGQARKGLKAIAGELDETGGEAGAMVDLKGRSQAEGEVPVRLLGAFDPILHGWTSREWIIPAEADHAVVTVNGLFRPTILAGDRIVGTWSMPKGKVELAPFGRLVPAVEEHLETEIARVRRFLDH